MLSENLVAIEDGTWVRLGGGTAVKVTHLHYSNNLSKGYSLELGKEDFIPHWMMVSAIVDEEEIGLCEAVMAEQIRLKQKQQG